MYTRLANREDKQRFNVQFPAMKAALDAVINVLPDQWEARLEARPKQNGRTEWTGTLLVGLRLENLYAAGFKPHGYILRISQAFDDQFIVSPGAIDAHPITVNDPDDLARIVRVIATPENQRAIEDRVREAYQAFCRASAPINWQEAMTALEPCQEHSPSI